MKWFLIGFTLIIFYIERDHAECCHSTKLFFDKPKEHKCKEIYGAQQRNDFCRINVCRDGRAHDGNYCGRGTCNIFGCNCNNGCYGDNGNPLDNFKKIYGSIIDGEIFTYE